VVGALPDFALRLAWPALDAPLWRAMLPGAAPIALVAFVSSLVVAESLGRRQGTRIVPQRELAGLAAANLAAAVSAGMPVAASFSRSVVIFEAGGRTRMTGVYTAALMGLAMWLLADVLAHLPRAVLAATIVVAVLSVLNWQPFALAWRYARSEWWLMLAVVALTLTVNAAWALGLGVAASIALLIQRTAQPHLALIGRVPGTEHYRNVGRYETEPTAGILSLRIDESLLFTNARGLVDVVTQQLVEHRNHHPDTRRVVLMMAPVNRIDLSGLRALHDLHDALALEQVRLDLSEVKGPVLDGLRAGGWADWFRGRLFLSHHHAMQDLHGRPF
ncbi:MAG TPA: SulP family inorganic anion transporter, partial [Rubrivivax sp.]|nr:SulP family inorganic anion transporter [Rubrivivax sp.]